MPSPSSRCRRSMATSSRSAFASADLAYCPDVSDFPQTTAERLRGLDLLVIDALQYQTHPSHLSLGEALDWIERLKPRRGGPDPHAHAARLRDGDERDADTSSPAMMAWSIEISIESIVMEEDADGWQY